MKTISSLLLFTLLFATSCKNKDECEDRQYQPYGDLLDAAIPYQDGQIVGFKTSGGEEFTATVTRNFELVKPDIPYVCEEFLEVLLETPASQTPFVEFIQRGSGGDDNIIQLAVSGHRNNSLSGFHFAITEDGTMETAFSGESTFHTSIELDGVAYNDVIEINETYDLPEDYYITQVFYNTEFGLLQYETVDGLIVNLID